jgi:hypothetical protein
MARQTTESRVGVIVRAAVDDALSPDFPLGVDLDPSNEGNSPDRARCRPTV